MTQLRFFIPTYETAMLRFISDVLEGFFAADPVFGQMRRQMDIHAGPVRNVRGPTPVDQMMPVIESVASIDVDDVRSANTEAYTDFLCELADSQIAGLANEFYKSLGEVVDAVGTSVDARSRPFSYDLLLDALEKLHIEFDENAEPRLPTLVMHPRLFERIKAIRPTTEQEKRHARIIEKKRTEYFAQKRSRRLS